VHSIAFPLLMKVADFIKLIRIKYIQYVGFEDVAKIKFTIKIAWA